MKSLKSLALEIVRNAGILVGTAVDRDQQTIAARFEHEGESFLTIALPAFCKGFERALANERATPDLFQGFKWRRGLPCFLQGFLELVFDRSTGKLLLEPNIEAIRAVRQVTLWLGKLFEVCDSDRLTASITAFEEVESTLGELDCQVELSASLSKVAVKHFGSSLSRIDQDVYAGRLFGNHGPGATADRVRGNAKFRIRRWTERLDVSFPAVDHVIPGYGHYRLIDSIKWDSPGSELPVRVVAVPKTAAKARIIAIEPTHMQYMQQALLRLFKREFSGSSPFIDLNDQGKNQELARIGSLDGSVSTIDLSDASDRVTLQLVRSVFARFPWLLEALEATRTQRARLPGGKIIHLKKFASMGSATCFPVESIVFATIALLSVEYYAEQTGAGNHLVKRWLQKTQVFGDDIVIPTAVVPTCLIFLEAFGLKVNAHKSFWTGEFRESCGKEYFRGNDVTVARLRKRLPAGKQHAREVASMVSFRNHLYNRGYWLVAMELDKGLKELGPLPIVEATSVLLGRESVCFKPPLQRWHEKHHVPLVRGMMLESRPPKSVADDIGALMKCLYPPRHEPFEDSKHLQRAGRPHTVYIKYGWSQPF